MTEQSSKILKSALQLAKISQKDKDSQRNIFNKWFQDSVKNYLFEQIAFSLIGKQLNCKTSRELQELIHKNIDRSKPKYMSIIDRYFFYINKYGQRDLFIQKLQDNFKNPIDISQYLHQISYKIEKTIRNDGMIQQPSLKNSQSFGSLLQFLNNIELPEVQANYDSLRNQQKTSHTTQKKQINNGIISDDEENDEQYMINCHPQMCIYDKQLSKQNENWYQKISENEQKKTESFQFLCESQDQNQFYYQNFYKHLPQIQNQQKIDLHHQNTNQSNYQTNQQSNYFPT
ncbi:hypothetical protein ABPG72_002572, partial [Tetrahymena utriculariae]